MGGREEFYRNLRRHKSTREDLASRLLPSVAQLAWQTGIRQSNPVDTTTVSSPSVRVNARDKVNWEGLPAVTACLLGLRRKLGCGSVDGVLASINMDSSVGGANIWRLHLAGSA